MSLRLALASLSLLSSAWCAPTGSSSSLVPTPSASTSVPPPSTLNVSLSAVCTPLECIQGANSLSAGAVVSTPTNATTYRSTVLLPGMYTNASLTNFGVTSTSNPSVGFTTAGSPSGLFTVSLLPGLTAYTSSMFQGIASHESLSSNSSTNSTLSPATSVSSFLLSPNTYAILQVGSSKRVVAWKSVADVSNLPSNTGSVSVLDLQSSSCVVPCASGGKCGDTGVCACKPGFAGDTCGSCAKGFFGPTCAACDATFLTCDDGITGTGRSLASNSTIVTASVCNCVNGACASPSASAPCACNAGWGPAANGTQCAACAVGYYPTASGDCLACDPSCATCAGPTGICLTCQPSLQPLSTSATKCTTATAAQKNGTFITCPSRTFFDPTSSTCVACNPLCETCFSGDATGCLACRAPNALLGGVCGAFDGKTGVCDPKGKSGGWILDNVKGECDALPAKCTAGSIDNFSPASTRGQLTCSACLAGTYLFNGACLATCPAGTTTSPDHKTCIACDPSCGTCSGSSTFCTTCSTPTSLILNGTCLSTPTCPASYFHAPNSPTCLPCHPDCETCGPTFDTCLSCPSTRPVLSKSSTCVSTCSAKEYFDTTKGSCAACAAGCDSCSGGGAGDCMSCGPSMILKQGSCVAAGCPLVVEGFGVCLSSLVVVAAPSFVSIAPTTTVLPWWTILLIVLGILILLTIAFLIIRRKQQARRRLQTFKFADDLAQKDVNTRLQALSTHVAYPPAPRAEDYDVHFVHEHERPPIARSVIGEMGSRWSVSTYGGSGTKGRKDPPPPLKLVKQDTGASAISGYSRTEDWGDRNPFKKVVG